MQSYHHIDALSQAAMMDEGRQGDSCQANGVCVCDTRSLAPLDTSATTRTAPQNPRFFSHTIAPHLLVATKHTNATWRSPTHRRSLPCGKSRSLGLGFSQPGVGIPVHCISSILPFPLAANPLIAGDRSVTITSPWEVPDCYIWLSVR